MTEIKTKRKSLLRELREWAVSIAFAVVIVFLCQTFLFSFVRVDGSSMATTLADGEFLFCTAWDIRFGSAERGDVVICRYPNRGRTLFVKRVVGVPGDTVYRENNVTHVVHDGMDEALDPNAYIRNPDYEPYVLGEDEYFVVGDNRYDSHDSRDWNDSDPSRDVGPITGKMITGHVRHVIYPFDSIRPVQ